MARKRRKTKQSKTEISTTEAFQEFDEENQTENTVEEKVEENVLPMKASKPQEIQTPTIAESFPQPEVEESVQNNQTIGKFIKEARESKNISLKVVSQSSKISITNLELLESDSMEKLPDRTYIAGYLKSISSILGISKDECLEKMDYTYSLLSPKQTGTKPLIQAPRKEIPTGLLIKAGAALAGLAVVVSIVMFVINREPSAPEVVVAEEEKVEEVIESVVPQSLSETSPLKQEESIKEKAESEAEAKRVAQELKAEEERLEAEKLAEAKKQAEEKAKKKKEVSDTDITAKLKKKFWAMRKPLYSVDKERSEDEINKEIPENFRNSIVEGQQNIFIKAVYQNAWLTYKVDGEPIKKFVLKKGRGLLVRGTEARVFIGNLAAVQVYLNNEALKLSSPTNVKSLVFPQEKRSKYVMPLFVFNKNGSVITSKDYLKENPPEED